MREPATTSLVCVTAAAATWRAKTACAIRTLDETRIVRPARPVALVWSERLVFVEEERDFGVRGSR